MHIQRILGRITEEGPGSGKLAFCGFQDLLQQGREGELPAVGKDEEGEGFVYFQGPPRISHMLL